MKKIISNNIWNSRFVKKIRDLNETRIEDDCLIWVWINQANNVPKPLRTSLLESLRMRPRNTSRLVIIKFTRNTTEYFIEPKSNA